MGILPTPLEYVISLIRWSFECVRLLNHIYLTLTTLYRSTIPLRLVWSTCSAFFYFDLFIPINRTGIFKRYCVVWQLANYKEESYRGVKPPSLKIVKLFRLEMVYSGSFLCIMNVTADVKAGCNLSKFASYSSFLHPLYHSGIWKRTSKATVRCVILPLFYVALWRSC